MVAPNHWRYTRTEGREQSKNQVPGGEARLGVTNRRNDAHQLFRTAGACRSARRGRSGIVTLGQPQRGRSFTVEFPYEGEFEIRDLRGQTLKMKIVCGPKGKP